MTCSETSRLHLVSPLSRKADRHNTRAASACHFCCQRCSSLMSVTSVCTWLCVCERVGFVVTPKWARKVAYLQHCVPDQTQLRKYWARGQTQPGAIRQPLDQSSISLGCLFDWYLPASLPYQHVWLVHTSVLHPTWLAFYFYFCFSFFFSPANPLLFFFSHSASHSTHPPWYLSLTLSLSVILFPFKPVTWDELRKSQRVWSTHACETSCLESQLRHFCCSRAKQTTAAFYEETAKGWCLSQFNPF